MLSLLHPEIMQFMATAGPGLWPIRTKDKRVALAVKASADLAYAAKHKKAFKFHFYGLTVGDEHAVGIITAFYDQSAAPVAIQTVCSDAIMRATMIEVAKYKDLKVCFFDNNSSELFGGEWSLVAQEGIANLFESFSSNLPRERMLEFYVALKQRFSNPKDGGLVIEATLVAETMPKNVSFIHVTEEAVISSRVEGYGIYQSALDSTNSPGDSHEAEIARFIARLYPAGQVVVNPEIEKGKEFCDVLAIGKYEAVVVQAKTSLRDADRFDEPAQRSNSRIDKHFRKAVAQAKGAERAFYRLGKTVSFQDIALSLTPETKLLIHVIIMYDKPSNLLEEWSKELLGFSSETTPVVVLDTAEFVNMFTFNKDRDSFLGALMTLAESFQLHKRIGEYSFHNGRIAIH